MKYCLISIDSSNQTNNVSSMYNIVSIGGHFEPLVSLNLFESCLYVKLFEIFTISHSHYSSKHILKLQSYI